MPEQKKLIQFKNIVKSFEDGQVVLKGFSLDIPCSEHGTDDCIFRFFTRKKACISHSCAWSHIIISIRRHRTQACYNARRVQCTRNDAKVNAGERLLPVINS